MQTRLLNANKMIRNKHILEVTSQNVGGPGSLFDPNIFGYGEATATTFGFIRLHGPVVHPLLYAISSRLWRDLPLIISGNKRFIIDESGDLIPDENGDTGLTWLYNNFDKINLSKLKTDDRTKLTTRKMKIAYDKLTRDEFFIDKIIVKPLHYRDLDTESDSIKMDELNQMYIDLLKAAEFRKRVMFESNWNDMKMQGIVNNIFEYFKKATNDKKTGLLKSSAMGRVVDNSIRLVITAPEVRNKDIIGKARHKLDHASIPLHHFLNGAPVHALGSTKRVLQSLFDYGKFPDMDQVDFDNFFNDEYIQECMINFDHSQIQRIKPVLGKNGREVLLTFDYRDDHGAAYREERYMTWMDLFFFAIQLYKHNLRAVLTRYPVTDKDSNIFVQPVVSTFVEDYGDCEVFLDHDDEEPIYSFKDEYPNIRKFIKSPGLLDKAFDETMRISNLYLGKLDGDDFKKVEFCA
jgi:hypothetical protein